MAAKIGGGGGGKFDLGQNSDMNVTPFVDVMLVLLIIFMVVAPLATTSIRIDLPPATPPERRQGQAAHVHFNPRQWSNISSRWARQL